MGDIVKILRRRLYNHKYFAYGFTEIQLDKAMQGLIGYRAIRGREQQLIDYYGGIGSAQLANKYRGVAKANIRGSAYWKLSNEVFGELHEFTGWL